MLESIIIGKGILMNILLYSWADLNDAILKKNLIESSHNVIVFSKRCKHYTKDMDLAWEMINIIHEKKIDAVISFNYLPIISMVCSTTAIPYYSWVFDSPHYTLFFKGINDPVNHIGCFDSELTKYYNRKGVKTIFHAPLGVDTSLFQFGNKNRCDVSFVGKMYTGEFFFYDRLEMEPGLKAQLDSITASQKFCYTQDRISGFFNNENIEEAVKNELDKSGLLLDEDYDNDYMHIFRSSVIDKKITVDERRELAEMLSELPYDFRLYTSSDVSKNPRLRRVFKGYADYYTKMPSVFKNSKININNTLRSIRKGVPLRVLDILACGGFVLSDYQPAIAEEFEEGREIAFYYSLEDCKEKVKYYLEHDEERTAIAMAGHRKVMESFPFKKRLSAVIQS